jgi:uncharacterized protein (TIGR04255 family)
MTRIAEFESPPIEEVVIAVEFPEIESLTIAHIAIFWDRELVHDWPHVAIRPPLDPNAERFDRSGVWNTAGTRVSIQETPDLLARAQFTDSGGERMVQIQDSRVVLNWRKRGGSYPHFDQLLPVFQDVYTRFCNFVQTLTGSPPQPHLWEVTYVNMIPKGELWNDVNDWGKVVPDLLTTVSNVDAGTLETVNINWSHLLPSEKARMRTSLRHSMRKSESGAQQEVIDLRFVTRGPIASGDMDTILEALTLGHDTIVNSFLAITSSEAQSVWGRTT